MRKVLAIIPVFERPDEIRALLRSMQSLRRETCQLSLVVVDDGSRVSLEDCVRSEAGGLDVLYLRNPSSCGPAHCRNLAAAHAKSDFVWFLDSDAEMLHADTLEAMLAAFAVAPDICAVGGAIESIDGEPLVQQLEILPNGFYLYRPFTTQEFTGRFVGGFGTCNMMVARAAYDRTGGFAEWLLRDEDMDLCIALTAQGGRFYMQTETCALHKCSSSGRDMGRFSFHKDEMLYIKAILETRTSILARHWRLRLALLPLLDLVLVPLMMYRVATGYYASKRIRYDVFAPRTHSLIIVAFAALTFVKSYLQGYCALFCAGPKTSKGRG